MTVFTTSAAYDSMSAVRHLVKSLMGGTEAMREAGETYLPMEPREDTASYGRRLARSTLYNQFDRTLNACLGKVLAKPIVYPDASETVKAWIEDIDMADSHLDVFSREWFKDGVANGVSYALVDAPKPIKIEGRNAADDSAENIRPYLVHVPAQAVIGWRHSTILGRQVLTQVRIEENVMVPDGEFGERLAERVRVLEIGSWRVFEKKVTESKLNGKTTKQVEEILVDQGTTDLPFIPLVAFYTNKTGPMTAQPPLANLAYLNLRHWQSYSDQCNILKVVRIPMLARTVAQGIQGDDEGTEVVVSAGSYTELVSGEKLEWVEHNGAAISSGRQDLMDIQDAMEKAGYQMTARETSGDVTATETSVNAAEAHAALQTMALNFQDSLEIALKYMCMMGNLDEEPSVIVNKEFGATASATDMQTLLQMHKDKLLTRKTALAESKRRGILSEDVNIEEEEAELDKQAEAEPVIEPDNLDQNSGDDIDPEIAE